MASMSAKNLLAPANPDAGSAGFNGIMPSLSQQLLDEEEDRMNQMKQQRSQTTAMTGGGSLNMPSLGLFGAGHSLLG
jgi:hypothetical protein